MDRKERRAAVAAYKQRKITGGVFRIVNRETGRRLLMADLDLKGAENRFRFSQATGSCTYGKLSGDWAKYGGTVFEFEALEEIEKKEEQSMEAFREELALLLELWTEREDSGALY